VQGFFVGDFSHRSAEAHVALAAWLKEGLLVIDEHIEEGIETQFLPFYGSCLARTMGMPLR